MSEDDLPQELRDLANEVVRRTRLWRSEKRDVRAELESHFREGLVELGKEGVEAEQAVRMLQEEFGDPKLAARLIRRGKRRGRSIVWKVFERASCAIGIATLIFVVYAGWLALGEPSPSVNYVAKMNEPIDAIPVEDRAWPILRPVLLDLTPIPEAVDPYDHEFWHLSADDEGWEAAVAWLESNRHLIPAIHEAAAKKIYGARYDNAESRVYFAERAKRRGEKLDWDPLEKSPSEQAGVNPVMEVLLPGLADVRRVAKLLLLDARVHLADGDFDDAWGSFDAAHGLGIQLIEASVLIEQLLGVVLVKFSCQGMNQALYEHCDELNGEQLLRVNMSRAMTTDASRIRFDYTTEQYIYRDLVQHLFTDDGDGNGTLIASQLRRFLLPTTGDSEDDPSEWMDGVPYMTVAALHADRKKTLAKLEEHWEAQAELFSLPLSDPRWVQRKEDRLASPLERVRFWVALMFLNGRSKVEMQTREAGMHHRGTQTLVALLRYRADHGQFPDTLDRLVPDYQAQTPVDVFSGKQLCYFIDEQGDMRLYSVGRDLADNGGSSEKVRHTMGFDVGKDSVADIVYWPPSRLP